jgi:5-methylcytosine-specific restriction enzyme subunit McrC
MPTTLTVFEYDRLIPGDEPLDGYGAIPLAAFDELRTRIVEELDEERRWLRPAKGPKGIPAIQVCGYVGVLRTRDGTQIEVLPKIGRHQNDQAEARAILLRMLRTLRGFRWYETAPANLAQARLPLFEVFIQQFLLATREVVRRGLRSDYVSRQDNLFALRGRLLVGQNLAQNLVRPDRFFAQYDEFTPDRPENRLIHTALLRVIRQSRSPANQRLGRELGFVFAEIPESTDIAADLKNKRIDRGMHHYEPALAWAELILRGYSPLTGSGKTAAPSLMFPMAEVFEAYVAQQLTRQLRPGLILTRQARKQYLVTHRQARWMQLKPDLLITDPAHGGSAKMLLDTKWKLLDQDDTDSQKKYGLSQGDFYQLYTYGHFYLPDGGDLVLIYPQTPRFQTPLEPFLFNVPEGRLRVWALPFRLAANGENGLIVPRNLQDVIAPIEHGITQETAAA